MMYLIQLSQQVSTFVINYQGHPFREALKDNRVLYHGLVGVGAIAVVCATELMPDFNEFLKLVPMSDGFRETVRIVMAADFALVFVVEKVCLYLFADYSAKPIAWRQPIEQTIKMSNYERLASTIEEAK